METRDPVVDFAKVGDDELLRRVTERDAAAFRALFDRYYPRVYGFVVRRLRDPSRSEEVVADVIFEVWRSADKFRGESQVSTWIFGIAHFKTIRAARQKRNSERMSSSDEVLESHAHQGRNPEESLAARQQLRRARRVLASLPAGLREAGEMAILEGLSYDEIANRLGITEGAVTSRVTRARQRLRARILPAVPLRGAQ